MIELGETIISDDIADQYFACDLLKCKGACCVEGDLGAPLEKGELQIIDKELPKILPYLSEEGKKAIEEHGAYVLDEEDDYSTTTIHGAECAFAVYDDKNILKCGIEQAWKDGEINFQKPISCHLYPIRAKKYEQFIALNYDRWDICNPACHHGQSLKVPLYRFLKLPLIRKFGEEWYKSLVEIIKEGRKNRHRKIKKKQT